MDELAEESLKEKYATLRLIFENIQANIFSVDRAYRYTSFNHAHAAVIQAIYGVEIQTGQSLLDCMTVTVDREIAKRNIDRALAGERFIESAFSGEEGRSRLYFEVTHNPIRAEDGTVIGVSVFSRDVTDRKRADEKIADLAKFPAENPNPVLRIQLDGMLIYANEACSPLLKAWDWQVGGTIPGQLHGMLRTVIENRNIHEQEIAVGSQTYLMLLVPVHGTNYINAYGKDITKHKLVETALRSSEHQLKSIYDTVGDNIFHLSVESGGRYRFMSVNRAFVVTTGIEDHQIIGKYVNEIIPEPSLSFAIGKYNEAIQKKAIVRWEETSEYPTGRLTGDVCVAPVFDDTGSCTFLVGAVHDITERKRAEEELRHANAYNRSLIEASLDPLVTIGPDGKIMDVNGATEVVTGVPRDRLIGDDFANYFTDPDEAREGYQKVLAEGLVKDYPLTIKDTSGKTTDVHYNATTYQNQKGEIEGVFAAARDITARKKAETALYLYSQRLAIINRLDRIISSNLDIATVYDAFVHEMKNLALFDRTSIILLDSGGQNWQMYRQWTQGKPAYPPSVWFPINDTAVEWVNQNKRVLLENRLGENGEWSEHQGLRQEGIRCRVLFPLIIQGKVIGMLSLASRQDAAYPPDVVILLQTLADQLAIAVQNSSLYQEARLTAEELEQRVQARTAQLEKANKDLESFSYSVSHDLRAPLRAINGFAQILARRHRESLDEEGRHYLDNVVEASTRMGILIDDLLQYSRIGRSSIHRQAISLEDLFSQILGDLETRISEAQAVVHLPPPGSLPLIQSDATVLSQIFTNILDNALTYRRPGIQPVIQVTYRAEEGCHIFSIADNGIGIPDEYLEKIFNVFQRLHTTEEYPGTGIGLAIVKKSVELLNGRAWAESVEGNGSTFWIEIPKE